MKKLFSKPIIKILTLLLLTSVPLGGAHAGTPANTEVIIVGAGLAGLATAHELKKNGIQYHILELTPRVGGRVRTVKYLRPGEKEIVADSGMEEYWESNPAVELLKELKLPVRSDFAASSLELQGKLEALKEGEDGDAFVNRILSESERKQLEAIKGRVAEIYPKLKAIREGKAQLDDSLKALISVSFADWVKSGAGTGAGTGAGKISPRVAEWIRVSVECEAGTGWDRFSALDGVDEFHIFLGKGELSYRVIGGNQIFTEALAKSVGQNNISVNRMVKRIDTSGAGVTVQYLDTQTNRVGTLRGKYLVSTIPLFRLFEVQFEPALSTAKRTAIATQTWGSYFKAHVFVKAEASKYWEKGEHSILPILSDSELGVIYDGAPDHEGKLRLLSLLVTGDQAEAFNFGQVDEVRAKISAGLEKLWPGIGKDLVDMEFYRYHPRAIAGWPVGRSRFDAQSDEVRKPERGVYFAGDFTESTHSSGAFQSAHRVVRQILEARKASK